MYILTVGDRERARQNNDFLIKDGYYRAVNGYCVKVELGVVTYEEGTVTTVPKSITQRQCRLQLVSEGIYGQVLSAISSLGEAAQIEWEYASDIQRDNPLVTAIQQLLGKTDAEMDTFFIEASKL